MHEKNNYKILLDEAWQKHLAPRGLNAPTVISAFAGCGGSSLGYSMVGFRELLAIEWDNNAVETFKINFPDVPVYHGDIAKLSIEECMKLSGLKQPGELDIFDGSPPCQGFSTAGKREFSDDRNQLFNEYVRLLKGLKPKIFVMENVSGMVKGKMKLIFAEIMRELKASGYKVSARLLNAMYFNVPQSRQRIIFIGAREDLGIEPRHPKGESKSITVRMAIANIVLGEHEKNETHLTPLYQKYWNESSPGKTIGKLNQNLRLDFNKPSKTLQKGEGNGGVYHPSQCRSLSKRELARIGSFPDQFNFIGEKRHAKNQIGNSVPPLFMKAIAEHVRKELLTRS